MDSLLHNLVNAKQFKHELEAAKFIENDRNTRNARLFSTFESRNVRLGCSEEAAARFREEGNVNFRKPETMEKAAWCYTRAIYAAPKDSPSLALAHGNRAAALFKLGKLEAAYYDCECALELKHPRANVILLRQATISSAQRNASGLKDCIEKLEGLEIAETVAVERLKKRLEGMLVQPQKLEAPAQELNYKGLANGKKISIMRSEKLGRYVVAEESIEANALIVAEDAAGFLLNESYRYVFLKESKPVDFLCDSCLEPDIVPFPCSDCCAVFYCSRACRENDASLHAIECKAYKVGMLDKKLHYLQFALRCLVNGFDSLLGKVTKLLKGKKCGSVEELWSIMQRTNDDEGIFGLYSDFHAFQEKFPLQKFLVVTSLFSNYLLEETQFFTDSRCARLAIMPSDEGWQIIVSTLLLRLLNIESLNSSSGQEYPSRFPSVSPKGDLNKYFDLKVNLHTVHVLYSKLNHSCDPNVSATCFGKQTYLIAKRDISAGEELRISYIRCGDYSFAERRQALLDRFGFCCDCDFCEKADDTKFVIQNRVACSRRCGALYVPRDTPACPQCGCRFDPEFYHRLELMNLLQKDSISKYRRLFTEYQNMRDFLPLDSELRINSASNILQDYLRVKDPSIFDDQQLNSQMLQISLDILAQQSANQFGYLGRVCLFMDVLALRKARKVDARIKSSVEKVKRTLELLDGSLLAMLRNYYNTYLSWICT